MALLGSSGYLFYPLIISIAEVILLFKFLKENGLLRRGFMRCVPFTGDFRRTSGPRGSSGSSRNLCASDDTFETAILRAFGGLLGCRCVPHDLRRTALLPCLLAA